MGIPPGNALLRCLILLWTGDYPAQSEVGKFVCSGIRPCHICKLEGVHLHKITVAIAKMY